MDRAAPSIPAPAEAPPKPHVRQDVADTAAEVAREAFRWATRVGTEAPEALDQIPEMATPDALQALDVAFVRECLDALLMGRYTRDGLEALHRAGILSVWLPEVEAMVGFADGEWRHKDVWLHTQQVVWQSVPRLEVRWGALLHDIGKIKTRKIDDRGQVHFFGHSEVGAAMFRRRVGNRLAMTGHLHDRVHYLILYHLRASQYDRSWTDSAVRRFARDMGDGLTDLLDLSRADITTKRPERRKRGVRQISELSNRIEGLQKLDAEVPPLPKGLGSEMISHFKLPPSKLVGDLRSWLEQQAKTGEIEAGRDIAYYIGVLQDNRATLGF